MEKFSGKRGHQKIEPLRVSYALGEVSIGGLWGWNHGTDVQKCGGKKKNPTPEMQPHREDQDNWAEEEAILYLKRKFST